MLGARLPVDRSAPPAMKDASQQPAPRPPAKTKQQEQFDSGTDSPSSSGSLTPQAKVDNATESSAAAPAQQNSTEAVTAAVPRHGRERDSSWLELEACREHLRQTCPRQAGECRYAHPDPRIYVKDGRVTCCYDFLKDRCFREKCRYFHPPVHIKERLVSAGKQFGAMMSNLYVVPGGGSQYPLNSSFSHLHRAAVPLMAPVIYSPDGRVMSAAPPGLIPTTPYGTGTQRIDVCPYFAQGKCTNPACPMIHPEPHVRLNMDSTVTVCRDFVRSGCSREKCRYFHPTNSMLLQLEHGAMSAVVQQGIVVASPVMPVYHPVMYGPGTSIPSPVGVPLYPTVPIPIVLTPTPPLSLPLTPVTLAQPYNCTPFPNITSIVQGPTNQTDNVVQSIIIAPMATSFHN